MATISQRDLRNDTEAIMRAVELGSTYTVTRRGVPVARLSPTSDASDLRVVRPATHRPRYSEMPRVALDEATGQPLDDLRGDR